MKFSGTLIAVQDMQKSLDFYRQLFEQEVAVDLGANKTLTCGLTLQAGFDALTGLSKADMKFRSNTMELYFETEDFEGFLRLLDEHPKVERLHEAKEFPWLQKGIRILDPDGHLIEVSESMYSVACRQFREGNDVTETSRLVQHPTSIVEAWFEKYLQENISVCGLDCTACHCFGDLCKGCRFHAGKVFHAPDGEACPIYECSINQKGLRDCGGCGHVPCDIWRNTREPGLSDEEFEEGIKARLHKLEKSE